MFNGYELLKSIVKERPVGSITNNIILDVLEKEFLSAGYNIDSIPFDCVLWESDKSFIKIGGVEIDINVSPFSRPFEGSGEAIMIKSMEELQEKACQDKIVILYDEITKNPIQPKNYPFYYPEEHKSLISLLESKRPKAIISFTGKHPMCGLSPFYMFEDGNFQIPTAYISESAFLEIKELMDKSLTATVCVKSKNQDVKSRQIIAYRRIKKSLGKIIICAHMDSKYNTPGTLDNAVGVVVLMQIMEKLKDTLSPYDIDFVPFNGEEYFGATSEVIYQEYISNRQENIVLVINIDSLCHVNSKTAISLYNMDKNMEESIENLMLKHRKIVRGANWYAGDHVPFMSNGIPCIAVTSSDLFDGALEFTHTQKDTLENIDFELTTHAVEFLIDIVKNIV